MALDSKYKALKSKHDLLKDAFKKLYTDYETLKGDLSVKIEEYAKLHDEKTQLHQSYEHFADELLVQKPSKSTRSSWVNPLGLMKSSDENVQSYTDEIAQLKSKLEGSVKENELLKMQSKRDLEDSKAEYNVIVNELKERLIVLEGILKDSQEQSNKNESKLSVFNDEIAGLKLKLHNKDKEIEALNKRVEKEKLCLEEESVYWKVKLTEKLKFDLRRINILNQNNIYQKLAFSIDFVSNRDVIINILNDLKLLFKSWLCALKFSETSTIITDATLQQKFENEYKNVGPSTQDLSFSHFNASDQSHLLFTRIDSIKFEIEIVLSKTCANIESIYTDDLYDIKFEHLSQLIQNINEFIKLQKLYLCIEEYLNPYESYKDATRQLITALNHFYLNTREMCDKFTGLMFVLWCRRREYTNVVLHTIMDVDNTSSLHENLGAHADRLIMAITVLIRKYDIIFTNLKDALSHRICHPKLFENVFYPLSGGTSEMTNLTFVLNRLQNDFLSLSESRIKSMVNDLDYSFRSALSAEHDPSQSCITHSSAEYIRSINSNLRESQSRVKLVDMENNLSAIERNVHECQELKEMLNSTRQELEVITFRSNEYEAELKSMNDLRIIEEICSSTFNKLEASYAEFNTNDYKTEHERDTLKQQLDRTEKKVRKLTVHLKRLLKTNDHLEDSNKQLKRVLEMNKEQYEVAKDNEDSIHRNYNEQIVLMSEHINELNNAILSSEYKIAELRQTRISCSSCGFNNTLGSMMSVDDKGRCSSCRCILLFSNP